MGVAQFGFGRHFIQADLHAALAARREGAARRRIQQVNRLALDGHQAFLLLGVQLGDGVDQALGVLVLGVVENLVGGAVLDDVTGVHDGDLLTHLGDTATQ